MDRMVPLSLCSTGYLVPCRLCTTHQSGVHLTGVDKKLCKARTWLTLVSGLTATHVHRDEELRKLQHAHLLFVCLKSEKIASTHSELFQANGAFGALDFTLLRSRRSSTSSTEPIVTPDLEELHQATCVAVNTVFQRLRHQGCASCDTPVPTPWGRGNLRTGLFNAKATCMQCHFQCSFGTGSRTKDGTIITSTRCLLRAEGQSDAASEVQNTTNFVSRQLGKDMHRESGNRNVMNSLHCITVDSAFKNNNGDGDAWWHRYLGIFRVYDNNDMESSLTRLDSPIKTLLKEGSTFYFVNVKSKHQPHKILSGRRGAIYEMYRDQPESTQSDSIHVHTIGPGGMLEEVDPSNMSVVLPTHQVWVRPLFTDDQAVPYLTAWEKRIAAEVIPMNAEPSDMVRLVDGTTSMFCSVGVVGNGTNSTNGGGSTNDANDANDAGKRSTGWFVRTGYLH